MALRRRIGFVASLAAVVVLLAYLRDPPWLQTYTYGFHPAERQPDGSLARWMGGHAAFHVPAELRSITLPLRSFKETPSDWPITALITIDDRPTERVTFQDDEWRRVTVRLPPTGDRRSRRLDIKLDRVRSRNLGLLVGEIEFHQ